MSDNTSSENAVESTVLCVKYNEQLPALAKAPFSGELGELIKKKVSAKAWLEWKDDMMIKIINEYRLDLSDAEHYQSLLEQMKSFLNLQDGQVLEVENEQRGKS